MTTSTMLDYWEHQVAQRFLRAGAVSPAKARSLRALDLPESWAFRALLKRGALRRTPQGLFYLDEAVWASSAASPSRSLAPVWTVLGTLVGAGLVALTLT